MKRKLFDKNILLNVTVHCACASTTTHVKKFLRSVNRLCCNVKNVLKMKIDLCQEIIQYIDKRKQQYSNLSKLIARILDSKYERRLHSIQ